MTPWLLLIVLWSCVLGLAACAGVLLADHMHQEGVQEGRYERVTPEPQLVVLRGGLGGRRIFDFEAEPEAS